jgi:hypothetical protein
MKYEAPAIVDRQAVEGLMIELVRQSDVAVVNL